MPPAGAGSRGSGGKQATLHGFFTKVTPTQGQNKNVAAPTPKSQPRPQAKATPVNAGSTVGLASGRSKPSEPLVTAHPSEPLLLDTPPPTGHRKKAKFPDSDGAPFQHDPPSSSSPASSPTLSRANRFPDSRSTGASTRREASSSRQLTPPPSSDPAPMDEDDDDEDQMPVRRRSAARKPISYAESEEEGAESDSDDEASDSFSASPSSRKRKRGGLSGKRQRSRRDEDDFIVSDHHEDASDDDAHSAVASMDEDDNKYEDDDDEDALPKAGRSKPKPSAAAKSSPLNAFKMGSSSASTPARGRTSSDTPPGRLVNSSLSHLTKAERRVIEEKRKKAENEQAYSFLVDLKDKDGNRPGEPNYDSRTVYIPKSAWKDFTPFEIQFWKIKQNHWDTVLFFQKGKFYELYEEDALIGHREFDLKLTDRVKMKMVGVPESSFDMFAAKFLALGYKVGRVDQTETAVAKGMRVGEKSRGGGSEIVNRELRHVLTSGTIVDASSLPDDMSNYCISIKEQQDPSGDGTLFGICTLDASTAEFNLTEFRDDESRSRLETLLRSLRLKEVLHEKAGLPAATLRVLRNTVPSSCQITMLKPDVEFLDADKTLQKLNTLFNPELDAETNFEDVGPIDPSLLPDAIGTMLDKATAVSALGALLMYLTQLNLDRDLCSSRNFNIFDPLRQDKCLVLDAQSLTHLNVLQNDEGTDEGTLLRLLNRCVTPFGKRLFKIWMVAPLASIDAIRARQDAVDDFLAHPGFEDVFDTFGRQLPDIERIIPRIHAGKCRPRDFTTVLKAFTKFDLAVQDLSAAAEAFEKDVISNLLQSIPNVTSMANELRSMFQMTEDGSFTPKQGVFETFDSAEDALNDIESKLEDELNTYRKQLKLNASKCGWKHIGSKDIYQIEVPASTKVPANWVRLSMTKERYRYYSPMVRDLVQELKEARETRLAALKQFHITLFEQFVEKSDSFLQAVKTVAEIDCLLSLAKASYAIGEPTCRPELVEHETALVEFDELRHPCIGGGTIDFIPNDIKLGGASDEVVILTGGNMAGKSTTARTTATAVIIAQLGCRVPAARARLSPVDRIASRMGANDQIFRNNSTFMVEMLEASRILAECTPRSLVIMDELGRGTSTFDGQAIAFAVLHHLVSRTRCLTFFLTHYTNLAYDFDAYPRVSNKHMQVLVDDEKREVVFTYRLVPGVAESSYGTQVAALAGVPHDICDRAAAVSKQFLDATKASLAKKEQSRIPLASLSDFVHLFRTADAEMPKDVDKHARAKILAVASQLDVIRAQVKNISAPVAAPATSSSGVKPEAKTGTRASGMRQTYGGRGRRTMLSDPISESAPTTPTSERYRSSSPEHPRSSPGPGAIFKTNARTRKPKKQAEQLILDLGQKIRITCRECSMSYDSSSPEDCTMHSKHHDRVVKGLDWTSKTLFTAGTEVITCHLRKPLSASTDAEEVKILRYEMNSVREAVAVRKLAEVAAAVDDALGAAPLPAETARLCKVFVAVRAGRVIGAAIVGRVPNGSARRVIPCRDKENKENATATERNDKIQILNDGGEAIFVSKPLPSSATPPVGIHRIHVIPAFRRSGLASMLLEAATNHSVYGLDLPALEKMYGGRAGTVAFSQPTEAGRKLAERWIRSSRGPNPAPEPSLIVFEA